MVWHSGRISLLLLTCSAALNLGLALKLRVAWQELAPTSFSSGAVAPDLPLEGVNGERSTLNFKAQPLPVLVYWFAPACAWCELNLENLKALAHQSGSRYRLVAISTGPRGQLSRYTRDRGLDFPVYWVPEETAKLFRFVGTPESLLIGRDGLLVKRWSGAYSPSVISDVERNLAVSLPGLTRSSS